MRGTKSIQMKKKNYERFFTIGGVHYRRFHCTTQLYNPLTVVYTNEVRRVRIIVTDLCMRDLAECEFIPNTTQCLCS